MAVAVLALVGSACSPNDETTGPTVADSSADTDGDGLTDGRELELGTSIELADTDGDGYTDFAEVIDLSFDPESNPYRFNPAVADIPEIDVQIVSPPIITVICTAGTENTESFSTSRSDAASRTVSTTESGSESQALAFGVTIGSETEVGTGGFKAKLDYEVSASETNTTTIGWSETQSSTNTSTFEMSQAYAQTNNETCTGGVISVSVSVENRGHIAFTLKDLVLSAFLTRTSDPTRLDPVGNLIFDTANQVRGFPETTLGPGGTISQLTFKNDSLDLESVTALLRDSRNLTVEVATAEVADSAGAAFAHSATTILANTATVLIDYGDARASERYQVGTNQVVGERGITLDRALRDDLLLGAEVDVSEVPWDFDGDGSTEGTTASAISRVRSVASDADLNAYWVLAVTADRGAGAVTTVYSPLEDGYDPGDIELRAGDVAHLAFIGDVDRDGVDNRVEFLHGTDPDNPDTDGDTLNDGAELRGWTISVNGSDLQVHSSPSLADTDFDGLDDPTEFAAGTHPGLRAQPAITGVRLDGSGSTIVVDALAEDLDGSVTEIEIDWGDSQVFAESGTAMSSVLDVEHTYVESGTYVVTIAAVDDSGFRTLEPFTIDVQVPIGLTAHWPLDGSAADVVSGVYDGEFTVMETYGSDAFDEAGRAADMTRGNEFVTVNFDSQFINYPSIQARHVPFTREFSISLWAQSFNPRGNYARMAGQGNWMSIFVDDGRVHFGILNERIPDRNVMVEDPEPWNGLWSHFVGTAAESEEGTLLTLYWDGIEVASRLVPNTTLDNPGECAFYIGNGLADVNDDPFMLNPTDPDDQNANPVAPLVGFSECDTPYTALYPGFLDEVRIYEIVLSAEDVLALYESGP